MVATPAPIQRAPSGDSRRGDAKAARDERNGHTEQELDDLAHQLYSRIGSRLRRELLVDRERAGFAIDLR